MKFSKLVILFGILFLFLNNLSAITVSSGEWADQSQSKTITDGESADFTAYIGNTESSMQISIKFYDSSYNLLHSFTDQNVQGTTFTQTYTITPSMYSGTGAYNIQLMSTDNSGSNTYTLDLTVNPQTQNNPPVISSISDQTMNENENYQYQVTAIDADNDVLTYSLNQAPSWISINSNTGLISGTAPEVNSDTDYIIEVNVSDGKDSSTDSYNLEVLNDPATPDTTVPVITIISPAQGNLYSSDIQQIQYSVSDNSGSVNSCWYSTDNGTTNSTPDSTCSNFTGLISSEGINIWTVYANDNSGNIGSSTVSFTKDTQNPLVQFTNGTINSGSYSQNFINIEIQTLDISLIEIILRLYNDSGLISSVTSPNSFNHIFSGLSDGYYYFNATAEDSVGNLESTETRTILLDTKAPTLEITYPENNKEYEKVTKLKYTVSDEFGLESCWYNLGGNNISVNCGENITEIDSNDGDKTWTVYARDTSGNVAFASVSFEVEEDDDDDKKDRTTEYSFEDFISDEEYLNQSKKRIPAPEIHINEEPKKSALARFFEAISNFLRKLFG